MLKGRIWYILKSTYSLYDSNHHFTYFNSQNGCKAAGDTDRNSKHPIRENTSNYIKSDKNAK